MRRLATLSFASLLLISSWIPLQAHDDAPADCPATILLPEGAPVFASIRRFEGVDPADLAEISRHAATGFLPLLKQAGGFLFYATMDSGDGSGSAINVFTSEEELQAANALAADYIAEHLAPLLPNPPEVFSGSGQILVYANRCPELSEDGADMADDGEKSETAAENDMDMMDMEEAPAVYLGYRVYRGLENLEDNLATIMTLTREQFVPPFSESEGFILYLNFYLPGEEGLVALNIFESEAQLTTANERVATFIAAELAELITRQPTRYGGSILVLDLSGLFPAAEMSAESAEMDEEADGG